MMNFRAGKASITEILSSNAGGRFITIGQQKQNKSAASFAAGKRFVQVYYSAGNFEEATGRRSGPVQHYVTYKIDLSVAAAAKVDLSKLKDPTATPSEKVAALSAMTEASEVADSSMDELIEIVYQIIMNGNNLDLGLPVGTFANRWINQINKDDPVPRGELLILTGSMLLQARTAEQTSGVTGTPGTTNDTTIEYPEDTADQGVTVIN